MEIKRLLLIVVTVLEAFFTTLSNGEYLISCSEHTMHAFSEIVRPQLAQWSVYLYVSRRLFKQDTLLSKK